MAGRFMRLSESTVQSASFTGGNTVAEAKKAVAAGLREVTYNVDIVEKGAIVDGSRLVKDIESPLHVVVHNADRQLPAWRQTTEKDIVSPWEEEPRCLMSCGHALTADNLYGYCWSQLTEQMSSFRCFADVGGQRCDWEWFFPEVAENACLSKDERILFESRINRNWINLSAGVRECPFCRCVCERQNPDDPHVPDCPSIRACPTCKILIEHKDQCKHMECRNCKTSFCFICLEVKGQRGFSCGSYNTKCTVASLQTVT